MSAVVRAVFFGTPALAVPALAALADIANVVGVVCQPDRPAGRGLEPRQPALKQAAIERGLNLLQPERVRTGELTRWLSALNADVALVLAYGRILPADVLAAPRFGCLNLHASLLPKYRGAAPIQWAIISGESCTGISLMQMDVGLDTGPVFTRHEIPIGAEETAGELAERLSLLAADVVRRDLPRVLAGELVATPQDAARATLAPPLQREHGSIDWTRPSKEVHDRIRGLAPRPGAHTTLRGKQLRVARTALLRAAPALAPGVVRAERREVLVGTGDGAVELVRAQLEGRREVAAVDLVNGRALAEGDVLGS